MYSRLTKGMPARTGNAFGVDWHDIAGVADTIWE